MAAVFETFYTELRAVILAAWPDVAGNGIYEEEQVEKLPWDKVKIPLATFEAAAMPVSQDWGAANESHEGRIDIYWVGKTTGDQSVQRARGESLRDALLTATFTNAQVVDVLTIDWSKLVPLNATFLSKNLSQSAVMVSVQVIVVSKQG